MGAIDIMQLRLWHPVWSGNLKCSHRDFNDGVASYATHHEMDRMDQCRGPNRS